MECTECKYRKQIPLKRCKHFELGGDKKRKVCIGCIRSNSCPRRIVLQIKEYQTSDQDVEVDDKKAWNVG